MTASLSIESTIEPTFELLGGILYRVKLNVEKKHTAGSKMFRLSNYDLDRTRCKIEVTFIILDIFDKTQCTHT